MKLFLLAFFVVAAVAIPIPDDEDTGNIDVIVNGVPEGEALNIEHIIGIHAKETVNGEVVAASDVLHPFTAVGIAQAAAVAAAAEAEAAAAQENEALPVETPVIPEPVVLPEAIVPVETPVIPAPVVLPEPVVPEVVVLPEPPVIVDLIAHEQETIPSPVALPDPVAPVVIPDPVVLPEAPAPGVVSPIVIAEVPATPVEVPATPVVVAEVPSTPIEVPATPIEVPASPVQVVESLPQPSLQTGEVYNNGVVSMLVNAQEPSLLSSLQNWFSAIIQYVTNGVATQTTQIV